MLRDGGGLLLRLLRCRQTFDWIGLKRNGTVELLEGRPGRIRAKRHSLDADGVEIRDDFGPKGDVIDPVVKRSLDPSAIVDEDNSGGMVSTGSKW